MSSSATRLRQIALVAPSLTRARHQLTHVLGTEVVFTDPAVAQWGLENFLVAIGGDIIEVVAPTKPNTTAGRLLDRRGHGGYMIIMQTLDADARRHYIENNKLSKVIFSHPFSHRYFSSSSASDGDKDEGVCIQYHPKGVKGGMLPELDSHAPSRTNPTPLATRFSPWHACGKDFAAYAAGMRRSAHLQLHSCTLRLAPGDADVQGAAAQWARIFGVQVRADEVMFTNARMKFVPGEEGVSEGLVSITIMVEGKERLLSILDRASRDGLCGDGWFEMVGVKWYLLLKEDPTAKL